MQRIRFRAMGCHMAAVVDSDAPEAAEALRNVPVWFEVWEQCLSRFRPSSELSRLNARAGEWVEVSDTLWAVLNAALEAARFTDGAVTPTVHDALLRVGYDRPFERLRSTLVQLVELPPPQAAVDWREIALDPDRRAVRLPRGVRVDLGGVAKGWCAEQAARRLAQIAPALVDAGGDIAVMPSAERQTAFPIGIANPFDEDRDIAQVALAAGCVATSGRDYRRWEVGGQVAHHLIAPQTGAPAETDVLAATVIAPDALRAEAGAKAAVLWGSVAALDRLEAQPELAGLIVREDGQVQITSQFARYGMVLGVRDESASITG